MSNTIQEIKIYVPNKKKALEGGATYTSSKNFKKNGNHYKCKVLPKSHFINGTLKEVKDGNSTIVVGKLKKKYIGGGLWDVLKNPIGTLKEAFSGVPTKLNNTATRTLQSTGEIPISRIDIARTPLNKMLEGAINAISFGAFSSAKQQTGYDSLYHLSLIFTLMDNRKIIYEKNEVVTIEPLQDSASIKNNTEYFRVLYGMGTTNLNTIIQKTLNFMGPKQFHDYDSFTNNCQHFISSTLQANNLLNKAASDFIMQNVGQIQTTLNNSGFSYVPTVMKKITSLGSIASRLMGKGTTDIAFKEFEKYMRDKELSKKDLKLLDKYFLDFINSEGIRFL